MSIANALASNNVHSPGLTQTARNTRRAFSESMLCYSLTIAAVLGCVATALLTMSGETLLRGMGTSAHLMKYALPYLQIRALAAPAVFITLVAQGACLGQQDMWTPMRVVLVSGLVNLLGDLWLILHFQLGTVGAAAATTVAQYAGAAFFLWYLHHKGKHGKGVPLKWKGLPRVKEMWPMLSMAGVLVQRSISLMVVYTALTAAATKLGTVEAAAHQVALQFFWLLSYFTEPFSLTAQTLIARDAADPVKVHRLAYILLFLGGLTGAVLALVQGCVLLGFPHIFSSDPAVISAVQMVAPHGMLALIVCSLAMICDGVSIGSRQMNHLPRLTAVSMLVVFWTLEFGAQAGLGLHGVWLSMVALFGSRVWLHAMYVKLHWRRSIFGENRVAVPA
eukprot:evm.model.scf_1691.1 EVM.evm.TU.scf_1691.1   scf_1691:1512-2895(-)